MFNDSFKARYKTVPIAIHEKKTMFPTRPHNHNEIELLLICQGKAEILINGDCFQVATGDLVFVNPLEVHAVMPDRSKPYCHRCICFDPTLIGHEKTQNALSAGNLKMPRYVNSQEIHNRYLVQKFDELYGCVEADRETLSMEIPAYIALMSAYLLNRGLFQQNTGKNENTVFCGRVHRYIAENYHLNITSKKAAEDLSFNQSYFCRSFRKNFGMTFSEYLNFYRVSASKKLIEENKLSIADIAAECGFTNPEYFSRSFKKYLGVVPREYKKSIQYG